MEEELEWKFNREFKDLNILRLRKIAGEVVERS